MKKECFFFKEKTFSSFKIASLANWEGAKYAGGSGPSYSTFLQTCEKSCGNLIVTYLRFNLKLGNVCMCGGEEEVLTIEIAFNIF